VRQEHTLQQHWQTLELIDQLENTVLLEHQYLLIDLLVTTDYKVLLVQINIHVQWVHIEVLSVQLQKQIV
jgi:hypothetical protein